MQLYGLAIRAVFTAVVSSTVALALVTTCGPAQQSGEPKKEKEQNLIRQD